MAVYHVSCHGLFSAKLEDEAEVAAPFPNVNHDEGTTAVAVAASLPIRLCFTGTGFLDETTPVLGDASERDAITRYEQLLAASAGAPAIETRQKTDAGLTPD